MVLINVPKTENPLTDGAAESLLRSNKSFKAQAYLYVWGILYQGQLTIQDTIAVIEYETTATNRIDWPVPLH